MTAMMSNFFKKLKKKLQVWHEQHTKRIEAKRQALLNEEAREIVQVMEFNRELYVCVNGIPLFGVGDINVTLPEAVEKARQHYKYWKEEKLWKK